MYSLFCILHLASRQLLPTVLGEINDVDLICNIARQSVVRFRTSPVCEILRRGKICKQLQMVTPYVTSVVRYVGIYAGLQKH